MKTIDEIKEKIESYAKSPVGKSMDNIVSTIPTFGDAKDCIKSIASLSYDIKLQNAWKCITNGYNIEASINEIYNYISDSERAFYISNEFRKIILSESCVASSIIAYIMGYVVREKRKCTHEEIIITTTLMQMCDFDIENYIELFDHCTIKLAGREVIELSKTNKDRASCFITLQLCASKGVFKIETDLIGEDLDDPEDIADAETLYAGIHYIKTDYSNTLRKYIDKVSQLIGRGEN